MTSMKKTILASAMVTALGVAGSADAAVYAYDWTGVFTMLNPTGAFFQNSDAKATDQGYQTPITGSMTFDTVSGAGTADVTPFSFNAGGYAIPHDITMQAIGAGDGSNPGTLVYGSMYFDWGGTNNIFVEIVLDAAGFFTATVDPGTGVMTMGTNAATPCYQTADCGGPAYVFSPTFDAALGINLNKGPAFMATLDGNPFSTDPRHSDGYSGIAMDNGPFLLHNANFDIYTVTFKGEVVPVPAAVWLFGSGLLGLVGVARRKKTAFS